MGFRLVAIIGLVLVVLIEQRLAFADPNQCQIAQHAIRDASAIRGLTIKRQVPCRLQDKEEVKGYLLETIKTKIPAQKLQMESLVFRTLGLLPESFDYEKGIVDLYLSQIGGYYDPEKQRYVMAAWLPDVLQTTVAVHELTHALQDQYFNLKLFTDEKKFNGDELLARSALVEGDATAVMMDYARRMMGQPPIASDKNVEGVMMQNVVGASMATSAVQVPQSLQLMLIFPYTAGLRFAHQALQKGGYPALDAMFKRPPRSTEEILHPEKYYAASPDFKVIQPKDFLPISLGTSVIKSDATVLYEDVVGEFATSILIGEVSGDKRLASKVAQGWGGDRVVVLEAATGERYLVWATNWDTEADAQEFKEAFAQQAKKVGGASFVLAQNTNSVIFAIRLNGK
jgi:hypothetical protein